MSPTMIANARHALSVAALVLAVVLHTATAQSQDVSDYRLGNEDWNGLSSFALLAEADGVVLEARARLQWSEVSPGDVLMLVSPTEAPDVGAIRRFVAHGGRLVLVDDFGESEALAASFGLARQGTIEHRLTFQSRAALPVVSPVGEHVLSEGVGVVVTNHPSGWTGPGIPVFRFDDGAALLYDLSFERGGALFWSDPSMLINLMLPLHDNQVLARNVLRRVCEGRAPCRVWLVTGDAELLGEPALEEQRPTVSEVVRSVRERVDQLTWPPGAKRAIGALLLLGALIIASTVFSWRAPRWIGVPKATLRDRPPAGDFFRAIARYDGSSGTTYALPTAMLKDDFERRFYHALGLQRPATGPGGRAGRRIAATRWVERTTAGLSVREQRQRTQRVLKSLEEFAALPSRSNVAVTPNASLDLAKFQKYQHIAHELLAPIESHA